MSRTDPEYNKTKISLASLSVPVVGLSEINLTTESNRITQGQLNFIIELQLSLHKKLDKLLALLEEQKLANDIDNLTNEFSNLKVKTTSSKLARIGKPTIFEISKKDKEIFTSIGTSDPSTS